MRSPISWMGGKFYEKDYLIPRMPVHKWYGEVFAGSCVLLLNKPKAKDTREFANDKFSCLVSFWEVLQDAKLAKQLQRRALRTIDSRYLYQRYMRLDPEKLDLVDRAYRFLYLIKFGFNCYDEETEILTDSGWKYFKDLTMEDKVATLDKNHTMYFEYPTEIQKYWYNDKMVRINHRSVDLLVTPNHKLYLRKHWKDKYEFVKAKDIKKTQYHTLNSVNWEGEEQEWFYLPQIQPIKYSSNNVFFEKFKMDDWLEFFGWYLAEGSSTIYSCDRNDRNTDTKSVHYQIKVAQIKENNRKEIINVINRLGYNPIKAGASIRINNKQLCVYLKKFGKSYEKYIPKWIMNLSKRQLKILFDAMMKGDGNIDSMQYFTTSKKLADQVQEIAMKLGYNSSVIIKSEIGDSHISEDKEIITRHTLYSVLIRSSKENCLNNSTGYNHFSEEYYSGYVYCCTVEPHHTVLVRRNGKSTWCGQSFMDTWHTPLSTELGKLKNITTTFRNTAKMLMKHQERIQEVKFSNYDFRKCLEKFKPHPELFLFLDPPYINTHSYDNGYYDEAEKGEKMYLDMREHLQRHHEGGTKWMITCNPDNPYFDEMDDIIIEYIDRRACINKNKERKDVKTKVIMNYDVTETGNVYELEFQDYEQGDHLSV